MSVEDTEIKLALLITSALVRKDADKLMEAVTAFLELHDLTVEQKRIDEIPVSSGNKARST